MAKKKLFDENGNPVKGKIKKPFYKKVWFWVLVVILIGAVGSMGGEDEAAENNADSETATETVEQTSTEEVEEEPETETSNEIVLGEPIKLGDYTMTIQSYSLATDYEGRDVLVVNYDWVNESDEAASPFMTFNLKGFQNDVETEDVFMVDGVDLGIGQKEVRPEGVIEGAQDIVGIDAMDQPLELELELLFSFTDNAYVTTLDLSSLQ